MNAVPHFGRSPRWRGRRPRHARPRPGRRTIPALAGTTARRDACPRRRWDDPRAGGDDMTVTIAILAVAGRSPRWRGRLRVSSRGTDGWRTIPALAGTTGSGPGSESLGPDDPRAGGDDSVVRLISVRDRGRSPRWRGRPSGDRDSRPRGGVGGRRDDPRAGGDDIVRCSDLSRLSWTIPALAGTTRAQPRRATTRADDPRAGGDDV